MTVSPVTTKMRRFHVVDIDVDPSVGLTNHQVEQMRQKYGRNVLSPPLRDPWWKQFLQKFDDPTIKILLGAAIISLIMTAVSKYLLNVHESSFIDSVGIFIAVALATIVGFLSERKSEREFELLNDVKESIDVKVIRDGEMHTIPISEIVVGDIVRLDMGDKIPADGVIIGSLHLSIDESLLTGESIPADKDSLGDTIAVENAADEVRVSRGTMVVDGHGVYVVTAVGDATKMGEIARALSEKQDGDDESSEDETPLKQKLSVLAKQISVAGVSAATLIFTIMAIKAYWESDLRVELENQQLELIIVTIISILLGILLMKKVIRPFFASMDMELTSPKLQVLMVIPMAVASFVFVSGIWGTVMIDPKLAIALLNSLLLAFVIAVTIIVVAVPEGLPMMVTVSLALNMMKMAKENCLVRKLIASETIGSATVICTDKTGTLTQNKMSPVWFYIGMKEFQAKDVKSTFDNPELDRIIRNIAINSEAQLEKKEERILGVGNPTECALLMLLHDRGVSYQELRELHPKSWQVDYNSERKMSVAVVEEHGKVSCYVKGAPERILESSTHVSINGELVPIEKHRGAILTALQSASEQSLRVIAFGENTLNSDCHNGDVQSCMSCGMHVFIGMVGIADPLREEVPGAVDTCRQAGIKVKMITGDAVSTAKAIALQAGILKPGDLVMTSAELHKVSDKDLQEVVNNLKVLARSTPMDKLRLVNALHRRGEVVAMTGDGTNDAPALKAADVGLSMGKSGTEVAKEASDIVLVDDNFKSIVTGVWWGRTLYNNIQRFLQFQLSVNVVALVSALIGPLLGVPLPLTVTQLLWINIIMDTFAALALSTDPPRPKTMMQKPVSRDTHIITPAMIVTILICSLYQVAILYAVLFSGWLAPGKELNSREALTVFFTVFVMFQFWHKFNCRALRHDDSPFQLLHKNKMFLIIVISITIVQIFMVQIGGPIGDIFRTTRLDLNQWLWILGLTATILPVSWLSRQIAYLVGAENVAVPASEI